MVANEKSENQLFKGSNYLKKIKIKRIFNRVEFYASSTNIMRIKLSFSDFHVHDVVERLWSDAELWLVLCWWNIQDDSAFRIHATRPRSDSWRLRSRNNILSYKTRQYQHSADWLEIVLPFFCFHYEPFLFFSFKIKQREPSTSHAEVPICKNYLKYTDNDFTRSYDGHLLSGPRWLAFGTCRLPWRQPITSVCVLHI